MASEQKITTSLETQSQTADYTLPSFPFLPQLTAGEEIYYQRKGNGRY